MFWSENPAFSPDTHMLVLLFASVRTGLEAPWVASSRLCHQWGHQEGDKIYQNVESSVHLSLTAEEGAILSPCPGRRARPRRCAQIARACSTFRPKPLYENTILLTHGNEKTFSLLFNHQSVSGFRIHLKEII